MEKESLPKKKKKFLYLEKFDSYKDATDLKLAKINKRLSLLMLGILVLTAAMIAGGLYLL